MLIKKEEVKKQMMTDLKKVCNEINYSPCHITIRPIEQDKHFIGATLGCGIYYKELVLAIRNLIYLRPVKERFYTY